MRDNLYKAFSSPTAGLLICWQYSGSTTKSAAEMHHLTMFLDDDHYKQEDARVFSILRKKRLIEDYLANTSNPFCADNGWWKSSVNIALPKRRESGPLKLMPLSSKLREYTTDL